MHRAFMHKTGEHHQAPFNTLQHNSRISTAFKTWKAPKHPFMLEEIPYHDYVDWMYAMEKFR